MLIPTVTLNNGHKMPSIGLGTWQSTNNEAYEAVKLAIDIGYRHFDTAMLYKNEAEVGKAIKEKIAEGVVKREEVYVVTKLWNVFHEKELVVPTCKKSLENLGLDYIDLYLIHWPVAQEPAGFNVEFPFSNAVGKDYDYVETWKAMEECVKLGLTKSIGLSNFNSKQVQRVVDNATIKPVVNQVEAHPLLNQKKLREFCAKRNIALTGYSPLGAQGRKFAKPEDPLLPLDDPRLLRIGQKYGKTGPQVILRYLIDSGITPLPKTTHANRLAENINVFDFQLSNEDIEALDSLDCHGRLLTADQLISIPHYPFLDEF